MSKVDLLLVIVSSRLVSSWRRTLTLPRTSPSLPTYLSTLDNPCSIDHAMRPSWLGRGRGRYLHKRPETR